MDSLMIDYVILCSNVVLGLVGGFRQTSYPEVEAVISNYIPTHLMT